MTATLSSFTRVADLSSATLAELLDVADEMRGRAAHYDGLLRGRVIACMFEEPWSSTQVSFAGASARLGAAPIAVAPMQLEVGGGATIADTARCLSGYVDAIVIQTSEQSSVDELARQASVPVVNASSSEHHPCQALADILTIRDAFGDLQGRHVAYVGNGTDGVAHSLLEACALAGVHLTIACPARHEPDPSVLAGARLLAVRTGALLRVTDEPEVAVKGAHAVYENVPAVDRSPYQVTDDLMGLAQPGAIFLQSLRTGRLAEVAGSVVAGPQSAVWQQSANRLPTEEALLLLLIGPRNMTQVPWFDEPALHKTADAVVRHCT